MLEIKSASRCQSVVKVCLALLLVFAAGAGLRARAQSDDPERERAFELFHSQSFIEALPLLEKLASKHPSDGGVVGRYGIVLFVTAPAVADPQKRKERLARARAALVRAKEIGLDGNLPSDLIDNMIATLNPDGSEVNAQKLSANKDVEEAMNTAEAAFSRGDYDNALKGYDRALQLDPKLYEAALYAGDAHLQKGDFEKAGQSYARAIQINSNRETAYRYWGNTYLRQARLDEARDKYIEAIIADPYNGYVWQNGLFRWAEKKGVRLGHPIIEPMRSLTPTGENKMTITLDPKSLGKTDDGTSAWMMYGITRAAWATDNHAKFKKEYPGEKQYRHSLREDADALRMVVQGVKTQTQEGKVKRLDPALEQLVKLDDDGLLEAYILFSRVLKVNSIAEDYIEYRKANRDKLRRYLLEYVASGRY